MARENGWTAEWLAEFGRRAKAQRWTTGPNISTDESKPRSVAPTAGRPTPKRVASSPPIYPLVGLCRAAGLPEPVPEYRFAWPARRFSADYCWPLHRLIVEIDGSIWQRGGGGHSHPLGILRDMERDNYAALLGFRTMRYTPAQMTNECLHDLKIIFAKE